MLLGEGAHLTEYSSKDAGNISTQCTELLSPPEGATVQFFRGTKKHETSLPVCELKSQPGNWHSVIRITIPPSYISNYIAQ